MATCMDLVTLGASLWMLVEFEFVSLPIGVSVTVKALLWVFAAAYGFKVILLDEH